MTVAAGDKSPAFTFGPVTRTDLVRYAGASGDMNPIHHDEDFARASGLPSVMAHGMLSAGLLASFVTRDPSKARRVCATDDKVDDLRRSLFRILVTHMLEDPSLISGALELLLVSQNLERIADLSTNVAEDVVFLVEGRTIKHGADGYLDDEDDDES